MYQYLIQVHVRVHVNEHVHVSEHVHVGVHVLMSVYVRVHVHIHNIKIPKFNSRMKHTPPPCCFGSAFILCELRSRFTGKFGGVSRSRSSSNFILYFLTVVGVF